MCTIQFITQFDLIMEYSRENLLTSHEQLLMLTLFHCANRLAQRDINHSWPEDFFPLSNAEIGLWCRLDKRAIEATRNSLKQRGLIDFTKGVRNKLQPTYKINYLQRVGYKIVPNNVPSNVPNNVPSSVPIVVPMNVPSSVPLSIDIDTGIDPEENDTHSSSQQQGNARAGGPEGKPLWWFDPAHPSDADNGWRQSTKVRCAVAQRLADYYVPKLGRGAYVTDDATLMDNDAVDVLAAAMEAGITPKQLAKVAQGSMEIWEWLAKIRLKAIDLGTAPAGWYSLRGDITRALKEIKEDEA